MERTEYTLSGYMGLRKAEENRLAEYYHGEYESVSPGPKYYVPVDEIEDIAAVYDTYDISSWQDRKAAIIDSCKAFRKEVIRRMFQVTSMQQLYELVDVVNEFDDALPRDFFPCWDYLVNTFDKAEARVRGLIRKMANNLRRAVFEFVKNNPELSIQIGNIKGMLFTFTKQEQYAYAWEVIAGK